MSNLDEFAWFMGPRERAHDITNSKTTGFPCWAPLLGLCGSRERESKTALLSQPYCLLRSIAWYVSVSTELSSAYISCHSEDWDYLLTRSGFQARPIGIQYLESNRPLLGILSYEIQRKVFHPLFLKRSLVVSHYPWNWIQELDGPRLKWEITCLKPTRYICLENIVRQSRLLYGRMKQIHNKNNTKRCNGLNIQIGSSDCWY